MVTKFIKRMLRAAGMPIRIERLIQVFSYVEKSCKEEKAPRKNQCLHDLIMWAIYVVRVRMSPY
jgi:hypothetical protein